MKALTRLCNDVEAASDDDVVVSLLRNLFTSSSREDLPWFLAILLSGLTRRAVAGTRLRTWAMAESGVPAWLYEESSALVGDAAETISLLVSGDGTYAEEALHGMMAELEALPTMTDDEQNIWVLSHWRTMHPEDRFVFNKLLSGTLRIRVAKGLVLRALSEALGVSSATLAYRLMRDWNPQSLRYEDLVAPEEALLHNVRPYIFCRAFTLDVVPTTLGSVSDWQAEWKWRGLRAQIIVRNGELFIWTHANELVTDKFPELRHIVNVITSSVVLHDGLVIDGEILAHGGGAMQPLSELQKRISRKSLTKSLLDDVPVCFMAYDILEHNGVDIRTQPLAARRALLSQVISHLGDPFVLSPIVEASTWTDLADMRAVARAKHCDGLILKRRDSPYMAGRERGLWWKWPVDPHRVRVVLLYAEAESPMRDAPFTNYTFGVWKDEVLVPLAKVKIDRTVDNQTPTAATIPAVDDASVQWSAVDAFIRSNTVEKFGPVRTVKPELVFELGFAAIERSARHKSGVVVRMPRILSLHTDIKAENADTIVKVLALFPTSSEAPHGR